MHRRIFRFQYYKYCNIVTTEYRLSEFWFYPLDGRPLFEFYPLNIVICRTSYIRILIIHQSIWSFRHKDTYFEEYLLNFFNYFAMHSQILLFLKHLFQQLMFCIVKKKKKKKSIIILHDKTRLPIFLRYNSFNYKYQLCLEISYATMH